MGVSDEGQSERWLSRFGEELRESGDQASGRWEGPARVPEWLAGESSRGTRARLEEEIIGLPSAPT